MGSPQQSCGVTPSHPAGDMSPMPRSEGDMAPAPCPASGGLRCRAVLLLAVCLSVTALPHGLGSLVAPLPGHLPQRGHGDPHNHPTMEPPASEGTSGCSCGEGNSNHGMGAAGLALGTPTGAVMLVDNSVPTSDLTTSSGFSDVQHEAPGAPARSPEGQERAVSPSPVPCHPASGVGEDHAAAHPQPPVGPSPALPSEETSSWAGARPGAAPVPSVPAVTPVGHWSLGTVSVSPPSAMSPRVSHPQVLVPSEGIRGPAVTLEEQTDPSPPPSKAHPVPVWTWVPSSSGSAEAGVSSAAPGATKAPHEDGAATGASWPPEPTLGSVPSPSSSTLAPRHPPSTTSSPSPSHPPASPAPSLQTPAVTPAAHPMSSPSPVTSWHPYDIPTATSWVAAGGTLTAEATSRSDPGSVGAQPPVRTLPLSFRLLGIAYTEALSRKASGSYRQLEDEVKLMLGQALSSYETFLQANVLEFRNGSVLVCGEILFRGDAPSSSHLIRTLLTEASRAGDTFSWRLEPRSVWSGGFSLENLDPEKLSISLTALQLGQNGAEPLVSEVIRALSALYPVRNFTISRLRPLRGDLEVTGDVYLDTAVHTDVAAVLRALTVLTSSSVDLSSLSVQGARLPLRVYPVSFLVTNRRFSERLLDPLAAEHRGLARDLGEAVARALKGHRSFLQAVIRGFLPGSLLCHGDVLFQPPTPTSLEVLEALALSVGPDEALAGSNFQVDPYSIAVGEDTLEPPPAPGFPESTVAIMVVCILGIITVPIVLLVCLRTKRGSWSDVAVLWNRRDPEVGTQTLEMENQGFWVASEQDTEEAPACWQTDSS
ncbi:uncharacterized protein LOC121076326 [Cygnus olor]|uniref:uncharacterized protein LOC121076326 n=1 Tax=Cygnus olor TaxID=8869 RepID=UPI001ADE4960|nr:uncharacterized protein LOC121076326 [Cygnus olor]